MRKHLFVTLLLACGMPLTGSFAAYAEPEPQAQGQAVQTITGSVLDENNEPVIGASVYEKGAKANAAATNFEGNFTLRVRPGAKIVVSYVGYKTVEIAAAQGMTVYMQPTTEMLNELVAIGYGTQKRANLTGAVATVDVAKVMDSRSTADVAKALQGSVPGLTITTANGDISSNPSIRIRGTGTLTNGQSADPLIVVDGVPVEDLSFVNPDDIAEISVLKDASSSAIYGTRAAFGVVLITTKSSAKKDKVSVTYSNNFAWSHGTAFPEFASTVDDIDMSLQSYYRSKNDDDQNLFGLLLKDVRPYAEKWAQQHSSYYTSYRELQPYVDENNVGDYRVLPDGTWLRYAQWDVAKTLFRTAPSQKHNVSLEGTSGKTQYRLSFGYDGREGLEKYNPDQLKRYTASANVSTEIFSWLKAGARFNYSQRDYASRGAGRNLYQYGWRWPSFFEMYGYMIDAEGDAVSTRSPLGYTLNAPLNHTINTQTRMQAWMDATIIPGLTLHADFTYAQMNMNSEDSRSPYKLWSTWGKNFPSSTWSPYTQATSYAAQSNRRTDMWMTNVYATYDKTFAQNHNLKVMVGGTAERWRHNYFYVKRQGLVDYSKPNLNLTNGQQYETEAERYNSATAGFFGRINYDYKGIYLLELNGRYDGSSRLNPNDQWAFFPSGSVGYRFSEENYFEPLKTWWSNGKLRASYGHVGNEGLANNAFLSTVSAIASSSVHWLDGNQKISEYGMPTLVPSTLTWERIETLDIGLDLGFLDNSLTFGFDWYQRYTKDMLAPAAELPSVLGVSAPFGNNGELRTRGWELSLGYNKSFGDAQVYASFNISDARSKITKWHSSADLIYSYDPNPDNTSYCEGTYYGDIWGFETDRYFEESDFTGKDATGQWIYADGVADQTALQTGSFIYGPGDIKFKDLNGDGKINNGVDGMKDADGNDIPKGTLRNHGDLKVIGNALPRYEYGFRLGGSWKGFDLDMFFQGVGKRNMWTTGSIFTPQSQSGQGVFTHQLSYNSYEVDASGNVIGYNIDQNNEYPAPYSAFILTGGSIANIGRGAFNYYPQSRYLLNTAYLRFKNLTVGYTLPAEITKKALIQRARIYFNAENLCFLYNGLSKYHMDPEINRSPSYKTAGQDDGIASFGRTIPMMRTFSFGLQVTF